MGILAYFSTLQLGRFCEETYLVMESLLELMGLFPSAMLTKWKNKILSIMRCVSYVLNPVYSLLESDKLIVYLYVTRGILVLLFLL